MLQFVHKEAEDETKKKSHRIDKPFNFQLSLEIIQKE